jgi:hypothetical protein
VSSRRIAGKSKSSAKRSSNSGGDTSISSKIVSIGDNGKKQIPKKMGVIKNKQLVEEDHQPITQTTIPQNSNINVVGTPIPQTFLEWILGNKRYIHYFTCYTNNGEKESCKITTNTPYLNAKISYTIKTDYHVNWGTNRGNTCTSTYVCPKIVGNNGETIYQFVIKTPKTPIKDTFSYSSQNLDEYSNVVLENTNDPENMKTFNLLTPNSSFAVEMS